MSAMMCLRSMRIQFVISQGCGPHKKCKPHDTEVGLTTDIRVVYGFCSFAKCVYRVLWNKHRT
eukprot:12239618-Alexandrium_andersonii.AAC.1